MTTSISATSTVPRRSTGAGLDLPAAGLGCMGMTFGYGQSDESEARRAFAVALDHGVDLIDTADMYGPFTNEEFVGAALGSRRDAVTLCSKVGSEIDGSGTITLAVDCSPAYIRRSIEGTLRRLRTDHLDVYYLHRIDPTVPVEESVGAMSELVERGLIRHVGLCEASAATLERAHATHPIAVLQSEYSLVTRDIEAHGTIAAAQRLGVGVVAYSPLGRGLLSGCVTASSRFGADDFRSVAPRFQPDNLATNVELIDRFVDLCDTFGRTPVAVATAWVVSEHSHVVCLTGARKARHVEEVLAAVGEPLTSEQRSALDDLFPFDALAGDRYPAGAMQYLDG